MTVTHEEYTAFVRSGLFTEGAKDTLSLAGLGLGGESGEVQDLLKKYLFHPGYTLDVDELGIELGDVFWYFTVILDYFNLDLEDVMMENTRKLCDRHDRPHPDYLK